MRKTLVRIPFYAVLFALTATHAWGQVTSTGFDGKILLKDSPLAEAQIILVGTETGRTYKVKSDKKGEFHLLGVQLGTYSVEIDAKSGECLYKKSTYIGKGQTGIEGTEVVLTINDPGEGCTPGAPGAQPDRKGDAAKKQEGGSKADQAKAGTTNAFLAQAREALSQQNWPAAEAALKQVLALDPDHWEYYVALGGAQGSQGKYQDAVQTYELGIQKAQATQPDPKNPFSDPAKIKSGISQMLNQEGNAYLRLDKTDDAVRAYTKAAESSPNSATAYYNLCSALFSMDRSQDALSACNKSLAADPNKADAYFIKGSILVAAGRLDSSGKRFVTADAVDALKKYLELAPTGSHAADAKLMLDKCVVGT